MIKIPVVYKGKGEPPKYATSLSAGMDLRLIYHRPLS